MMQPALTSRAPALPAPCLCQQAAALVQRRPQRPAVVCRASERLDQTLETACHVCRRSTLLLAGTAVVGAGLPLPANAAKGSRNSELTVAKDPNDGYQFAYPFGWQEVSVKGQDLAYKDIIEPLESVSVSLTPTDKKNIAEYGDVAEVAFTLANNVLTPPKQSVKILDLKEKDISGRKYYVFEFAAKASTYIRHALAVVTVGNGNLYTLTTGSNEFRWGKMKTKVQDVIDSFEVFDKAPSGL